MAKLSPEEKRKRVAELEKIIHEAEAEIYSILEPNTEPSQIPKKLNFTLPKDFGLRKKALDIINEKGAEGKTTKADLIKTIEDRFGTTITGDQAQGVLSNLKADGKVKIVGRGEYTINN